MVMKKIELSICTLEGEVFCGKVRSVELPGAMGRFEVLIDHAPVVSKLVKGVVSYREDMNKEKVGVCIEGGVVEVEKNEVKVLARMATDGMAKEG